MARRLLAKGRNLIKRKRTKVDYREEKILLLREQTILAKERTVLSFMRTGLASIGAGIVIINIFPTVHAQTIGWAFILTGIVEIVESYRRLRNYQKKMNIINHRLDE
jgi:uncharacterized membrane protein YidH (DUF202 family)